MRVLLTANPMNALVEAYRCLILKGQVPPWGTTVFLALSALVVFLVGYRVFTRMQPAFADVI